MSFLRRVREIIAVRLKETRDAIVVLPFVTTNFGFIIAFRFFQWIIIHFLPIPQAMAGRIFKGAIPNVFSQEDLKEYDEPYCKVEEGDIVIDCGAFVGEHSLHFAEMAGGEGKVIAIEPESRNFRLLCNMVAHNKTRMAKREIAAILPLKVAVYKQDSKKELRLSKYETTHSLCDYLDTLRWAKKSFTERVEVVEAKRIDTIVEELGLERVDFIKMDIEGAEVDALLGAEETISHFKPKLAICTYHRPTHPVEIREILLKYNPTYRFKELVKAEKILFAWDENCHK